jgi:NAD(P)-dependent dehydrogenase (short-subunit alcohol dehydrogenase family)
MRLAGRVVAVTGGGQGLGAEIAREAARRGAAGVGVIDLDEDSARGVAEELGGAAAAGDVGSEESLRAAIAIIESRVGPIDVFVSNAGVTDRASNPFTPDAAWDRAWRIHAMSNVYAARILLPGMIARGGGHLVSTASSNALTTSPIEMAYAVSKHAQLAVAEWLAMTYADDGIAVTCFCPKGMKTPMLLATAAAGNAYAQNALESAVTPAEAAAICLDAVEADRFMAVTTTKVADEFALKGRDYEAWIAQARRMHAEFAPTAGRPA